MTETVPTIEGEIRAAMARQRISQIDLAQRVGRNQQWLSRRLNRQTPITVDELELLATALGVEPAELLRASL